jgi:hypothetical protein
MTRATVWFGFHINLSTVVLDDLNIIYLHEIYVPTYPLILRTPGDLSWRTFPLLDLRRYKASDFLP